MTFESKIKTLLIDNGMWENQADDVISLMKSDKVFDAMKNRWQEEISGYPDTMLAGIWLSAKLTALDYIEKTMPNAWFKPMFSGKIPF